MGAHFERGRILASLRRYAEAIEAYRQELAFDPNCVATHANIAAAQFNLGRISDAEDTIRRSLGIDPTFAHSHYILSMIERRRGKLDAALAASHEAVAPNATFFCELARVHNDSRRPADALTVTASALALEPRHAASAILRAELLKSLGRSEEAADVLRSQLSADAENAEVVASLGNIALEMRNTAEAIDLLHEGRRLDPVAHLNRDRLAEAYGRRLRPFRALDRFLRSLELWKPLRRWSVMAAIATSLVVLQLLTYRPQGYAVVAVVVYFILALNTVALVRLPWLADVYPRIVAKLLYRRRLDLRWRDVLGEALRRGAAAFCFLLLPVTLVAIRMALDPQVTFWGAAIIAVLDPIHRIRRIFPNYGPLLYWPLGFGVAILVGFGASCILDERLATLGWWVAIVAIAFACQWLIRRMELRRSAIKPPERSVIA